MDKQQLQIEGIHLFPDEVAHWASEVLTPLVGHVPNGKPIPDVLVITNQRLLLCPRANLGRLLAASAIGSVAQTVGLGHAAALFVAGAAHQATISLVKLKLPKVKRDIRWPDVTAVHEHDEKRLLGVTFRYELEVRNGDAFEFWFKGHIGGDKPFLQVAREQGISLRPSPHPKSYVQAFLASGGESASGLSAPPSLPNDSSAPATPPVPGTSRPVIRLGPDSVVKPTPTATSAPGRPEHHPCPACGAHNLPDVKFCEECGASLSRPCPECARELSVAKRFCGGCGTAVETFGLVEAACVQIETHLKDGSYSQTMADVRQVETMGFAPKGEKGRALLLAVQLAKQQATERHREMLEHDIATAAANRDGARIQALLSESAAHPGYSLSGSDALLQRVACWQDLDRGQARIDEANRFMKLRDWESAWNAATGWHIAHSAMALEDRNAEAALEGKRAKLVAIITAEWFNDIEADAREQLAALHLAVDGNPSTIAFPGIPSIPSLPPQIEAFHAERLSALRQAMEHAKQRVEAQREHCARLKCIERENGKLAQIQALMTSGDWPAAWAAVNGDGLDPQDFHAEEHAAVQKVNASRRAMRNQLSCSWFEAVSSKATRENEAAALFIKQRKWDKAAAALTSVGFLPPEIEETYKTVLLQILNDRIALKKMIKERSSNIRETST